MTTITFPENFDLTALKYSIRKAARMVEGLLYTTATFSDYTTSNLAHLGQNLSELAIIDADGNITVKEFETPILILAHKKYNDALMDCKTIADAEALLGERLIFVTDKIRQEKGNGKIKAKVERAQRLARS